MKVAFVNQPTDAAKLPVQSGSIAIWTYQVARRLAKSCDVIVYARRSPEQEKVEYDEGVEYRRVSVDSDKILRGILKVVSKFNDEVKRPSFTSIWYHLGYGLKVANDLRSQQCDLVHIQGFSQFVPIIRAINPKIKIVLHLHGDRFIQLEKKMIEPRFAQANLVLSCSDHVTNKMRSTFPAIASRFQTILNGVDINCFPEKHYDKQKENQAGKLLFIGRVSPEKGVHVLAEAFKKVVEAYPETQLKIIGPQVSAPIEFITFDNELMFKKLAPLYSGSYVSHLRELLPSNVEKQVVFTGNIAHSKLSQYLQEADIFVFPSVVNEPFGIPVVEAMATGLPVVATQSGGITETVAEGKTGLLVERDNATALSDAIIQLLSNEELRKSMGKAGQKRAVELFSWEQIVEKLLARYKNMDEIGL